MKNMILLVIFGLLHATSFAQTDQKNLEKYWKFRASFKKNFIRIGTEDGESLPMGRRGFFKCINFDWNNTDLTYTQVKAIGNRYGQLYWGDGVIRHGHYIGFLATEYALLKKNGQDVTATVNELYYALNAFNRLDSMAEPIISELKQTIPDQYPNLNGFYIRDDVKKDFHDHWKGEPIKARGVSGDRYYNNNSGGAHDTTSGFYSYYNTYQLSIPSLDQMTSMLVGLKVCDKLIPENLWVRPTPVDSAMNLANEIRQITNRIITHAKEHNWFLLNMNGWPVGNGGGDLAFTAHPICEIGNQIVGNNYHSSVQRRPSQKYKYMRNYLTKKTQAERIAYYNSLSNSQQNRIDWFLNNFTDDWPIGESIFEKWEKSGALNIATTSNVTAIFWSLAIGNKWPDMYLDWQGDFKFDQTLPSPLSNISFDEINISDYNNTILYNLGVGSGIFSRQVTKDWEDATFNHQLALVQALLTDDTPITNQAVYQGILNSMPVSGSFKFEESFDNDDTAVANGYPIPVISQVVFPAQWGGEYRWTHYYESQWGYEGNRGQYTGLDYMYLHNLYSLVYENTGLPEYKEDYKCICESIDNANILKENVINNLVIENYYDIDGNIIGFDTVSEQKTYIDSIRQIANSDGGFLPETRAQLNNLESCVPNCFTQFSNNQLNIHDTLGALHDTYEAMEILQTNYQTETFTIQSTGKLDVKSRMIVCENKTLLIEQGGELNILSGEIRVNKNATLVIEGDVLVEHDTKIILEDSSRLVIRGTGKLTNKGYIEVNDDAVVEYEDGAWLQMANHKSELHLNGGDLLIKANADFTFHHGLAHSGHIRMSKAGQHIFGETDAKFTLSGYSKTDTILILEEDADLWTDSNVKRISMSHGLVKMHENSRVVGEQVLLAHHVAFENQDLTNRGIVTFDRTRFYDCDLTEVPIIANQQYQTTAWLEITDSDIIKSEGTAVSVRGKYYKVSNTDFKLSNTTIGIYSNYLNTPSQIYNSNFTGETNELQGTQFVYDRSSSLLKVIGCDLDTSAIGIRKKLGNLFLRCNSFSDIYSPIISDNYNTLNISSSNIENGYNSFSNSLSTPIFFRHSRLPDLNLGYNVFNAGTSTNKLMEGKIFTNVSSLMGLANRWQQNAANIPSQSRFDILNGYNNQMTVSALQVSPIVTCGYFDEILVVSNPFTSLPSATSLPTIDGGTVGVSGSMRIDNLVQEAIRKSETVDTVSGSNQDALAIFEHVITYNYDYTVVSESDVHPVLEYAFTNMKHTFQDAVAKEQVPSHAELTSFDALSQLYVDAMNKRSQDLSTSTLHYKKFHHELEKVEFYHSIGLPNIALSILYNTENCGLDSIDQTVLNNYKFQLEEYNTRKNTTYTQKMKDTTYTDTSTYTNPTNSTNATYAFGTVINSLFAIDYSNDCNSQQNSAKAEVGTGISAFPNPSARFVTFAYTIGLIDNALIRVYSLDGKLILVKHLDSDINQETIDISELPSGLYIYKYEINGELNATGKITKL